MYSAAGSQEKSIVGLSIAANFVCNNTAYRLARHFSETDIPFGLIHVPHQGCDSSTRDSKKLAEVLAKMLRKVVESYRTAELGTKLASLQPRHQNALPVSKEELQELRKRALQASDQDYIDFLKALEVEYEKSAAPVKPKPSLWNRI